MKENKIFVIFLRVRQAPWHHQHLLISTSIHLLSCAMEEKKKSLLHDDHKQMVRDTPPHPNAPEIIHLLWQLKFGSAHQNKGRDVAES